MADEIKEVVSPIAHIPEGVLKVVAKAYLDNPEGMTDSEMGHLVYASGCTVKRWRRMLIQLYKADFSSYLVKGLKKYKLNGFI